ncbi:hypothetical protein PHBOTO_001271, partial [Pseudozyma hubeiensis]
HEARLTVRHRQSRERRSQPDQRTCRNGKSLSRVFANPREDTARPSRLSISAFIIIGETDRPSFLRTSRTRAATTSAFVLSPVHSFKIDSCCCCEERRTAAGQPRWNHDSIGI